MVMTMLNALTPLAWVRFDGNHPVYADRSAQPLGSSVGFGEIFTTPV